jgi:hypothetical protein
LEVLPQNVSAVETSRDQGAEGGSAGNSKPKQTRKRTKFKKAVRVNQAKQESKLEKVVKIKQAKKESKQKQAVENKQSEFESKGEVEIVGESKGDTSAAGTGLTGEPKSRYRFNPFSLLFGILTAVTFGTESFQANAVEPCDFAASSTTNKRRRIVLFDTGCNVSCTNVMVWLRKLFRAAVNMKTANGGDSPCTQGGSVLVKGVELKLLLVPDFNKTLISWTDLAAMGMTATMGATEIKIIQASGSDWLSATLQKDGLWHFLDLEDTL